MKGLTCIAVALTAITIFAPAPILAADRVKVYVLAGQSNMEGKAQNVLWEHQAKDPKTRAQFAHLQKDGQWIVRNDVFIKFLGRHGGLTLGYGSRDRTGAELEFGTVVGDHHDDPVILIKAAWGGKSLYKPFRPPSAGLPSEERLASELAQARKNIERRNAKDKRNQPLPTIDEIRAGYGVCYRDMLAEVKAVTEGYATLFPTLAGKKLELAGFVWFQGWNDQYGGAELEYERNMKLFIQDVRRDLNAPKLPFVIAVMGQNGSKVAKGPMLTIQRAQLAMNDVPEFKDNVTAIRTDRLVDVAAEKLYPTWKENRDEWNKTGSDHGYHYLGSAIWYTRIGHELAIAMLDLEERKKQPQ